MDGPHDKSRHHIRRPGGTTYPVGPMFRGRPLAQAKLDDPVSKHIHQDFTRLASGQSVGDALDWLRGNPPRERIIYFYVVDGDDHLLGVVPTRRLLLSP